MLTAVLWGVFASVASAQSVSTEGTLGAANQCVTLDVAGMGTATFDVTRTWAGTITFSVIGAGATQNTLDVAKADTPGTAVNTTTENGVWSGSVAGYRYAQACMTSYTSGTAGVSILAAGTGGGSGGGSGGGGGEVTNAGTFAVQVTSVAAGDNNIGNVDVVTMPTTTVTATNLDVQIGGSDTVTVSATNLDVQIGGSDTLTVGTITTSVTPGTGATNLGKAEDGVATSGDVGVMALAVYNEAGTALAADGDYTPLQTDATGQLRVTMATPNAQYIEDTGHNSGDTVTMAGVIVNDSPDAISSEGDVTVLSTDAEGRLHAAALLVDSNGAALSLASDVVEDVAETAGVSGPAVLNVRRDVAASSSGATGDNSTFNTDALGLLWSRMLDPCSGVAKQYLPIDIVTATTTEITAALAGASTHYYICSVALITALANNVAIVDDDSDNCASVTSGVMGGTTSGEGFNLAANGGLTFGNGAGSIARTVGTNRVLCIVTSAATQLSGTITVVAAP